jgi:CheY-like chemotaxis protein
MTRVFESIFTTLQLDAMKMYATEDSPSARRSLSRKLNFLLVDDDEICLFIHRRVLDLSGYCSSTHSASNGKTALGILDDAAQGSIPVPDVILLDLEMPIMNGIAFLEAFQKLKCPKKDQIAVVLLTSSVSGRDLAYAKTLGVSQCMSKPLTQEALDALVHKLCGPCCRESANAGRPDNRP